MSLNTVEEEFFINTLSNPTLWSQTFLRDPTDPQKNLTFREYQSVVTDNTRTEKMMVLRYGRRMGKCLRNALILNDLGELVKIEDLVNKTGFGVISLTDNLSQKDTHQTKCFSNGIKPVFKLKTKSGRRIEATENHPFLTACGWKELRDIQIGSSIVVPSKIKINTSEEIPEFKVKAIAYLLSDGCITNYITFGNNIEKVKNEFKNTVEQFNGCSYRISKSKGDYEEYYVRGIKKENGKYLKNSLLQYIKSLKLFGKNSHTKFIPNEIMRLSKRQQSLFLSRLYACDGWASVSKSNRVSGNCEIGYCSVSEELAYGVGHLLTRFGIRYFITERCVKYNGTLKKAFQICIRTKSDVLKFIDEIGIFGKEAACDNVRSYINARNDKETYFDTFPTKDIIEFYTIKNPRKNEIRKQYKRTSKFKFKEYAEKYNEVELLELCNSDIFFDEVVSIDYIGQEETFDLEVFPYHNFIANDIITHNTVVLCADALWWATAWPLVEMYENGGTKAKPFRVLIFTPMDAQIKMIFDTLLALCADSPFIQDMVHKIKRSDVSEIVFNNGSVIKGMTLGIATANKGTSARGQSADYLFIDEVDYVPRDVLEQSVLPIGNTNPNVKIRACSTPSGKREHFFEWCSKPEKGWWSRHYPSWHPSNPNWISIEQAKERGLPIHESTEYQWRSNLSTEAYMREFGAEFGEELQGVYKHTFINKSLVNYTNTHRSSDPDLFDPGFKQTPGNIYIIGVDWNTYTHGGQVVVLEYCKVPTYISYFDHTKNEDFLYDCTGKFRVFYRRGVKAEEATQRETRLEIIKCMRKYEIDFVYVDYGAGDTNIEELTLYGRQHPELAINRKLHIVDAGSNIEHYDPILRQTVKKRAKSMMVNTSANYLEQGIFCLPREEDVNHRLVEQMRTYCVKNITVRGDFTYVGEDHILDAFNLAIHGFQMQHTILLATRYENKIKFMANPMLENAPMRQQPSETKNFVKQTQAIEDPEKTAERRTTTRNFSLPGWSRGNRTRSIVGTGFRRTF